MIIEFFQKKTSLFILLILAVFIWYNQLLGGDSISVPLETPVFQLFQSLRNISGRSLDIITFLLLSLFVVLASYVYSKGKDVRNSIYYAMFVFIIVSGYEIPIVQSNLGFIAVILFLIVNFLIGSRDKDLTPIQLFNIGMVWGIFTLICPILVFTLPLIIIKISCCASFTSFKGYFTYIFGVVTIWILFSAFLLLQSKTFILLDTLQDLLTREKYLVLSEFYLYIPIITFTLTSIIYVLTNGRFMKKAVLKFYESIIIQLGYSFICLLIFPQSTSITYLLCIFFSSILIGLMFNSFKGKYLPWLGLIFLIICIVIPYCIFY